MRGIDMKRIVRGCVMSLAVLLMVAPVNVYGIGVEDFSKNKIINYNPGDTTCENGGSVLSGDSNITKIASYLIGKGLKDYQAAGVLGNIEKEGQFSPTRQEDSQPFGQGGWAIVQWTGSRRTQIVDAVTAKFPELMAKYYKAEYGKAASPENGYVPAGMEVADNDKILSVELDFLYQESTTRTVRSGIGSEAGISEWEAIKASGSVAEASKIWMLSFERPADQSQSAQDERAKLGEKILESLSGISGSSGGVCASGPGPVDTSGIENATIAYAWPEYRGKDTTRREEYAQAISAAQKRGDYIGGCNGVDCGGFVTRLLIDSGFEPEYNSSGRGGNTDSQKAWLDANWQVVGKGNEIDVATLQPGDVAMQPGHTFVYVGDNITYINEGGQEVKFDSVIASASLCERAPMAGVESLVDSSVTWYRKGR